MERNVINLPTDSREFIELLNSHEVRYLVVGGYAVAYHGYPRTTGDIDFFIEVSPENASRLEQVMTAFGFASLGLTAQDFLQKGVIVQLGYPPNRIDIITALSGVEFEDAWARRVSDVIDGVPATILDKQSLIDNKMRAGRHKDLNDVNRLK
jgi:hypothetical protein